MAEPAVLAAALKCGIVSEEGRSVKSDMDESGEEILG